MIILAIDPGQEFSGYVIMDGYTPIEFGKIENEKMLEVIRHASAAYGTIDVVIEKIESYGITVSESIFTTIFWCGRYWQTAKSLGLRLNWVTRRAVKSNLCKGEKFETKSWDSKISEALRRRFGKKGTKAEPGFFFGFKADIWSAYAVGVTFIDKGRKRHGKNSEKRGRI